MKMRHEVQGMENAELNCPDLVMQTMVSIEMGFGIKTKIRTQMLELAALPKTWSEQSGQPHCKLIITFDNFSIDTV